MISYVDKEGRTILKKVQYNTTENTAGEEEKAYTETYYIYDITGNLVVVIPPEGAKAIRDYYE